MIFELLNEKKYISNISYMLFPQLRLPTNASCLRGSTTHSLWPSGMSTFCKVSLNSHPWLSSLLPWLFALWFLIYKSIFMWGGNKSLAASCIFHFSFVVGLVLREELFLKKKNYWIWGPRKKWNYSWGPSLEEYPGVKYAHTIQTERESKQRMSLLFPW